MIYNFNTFLNEFSRWAAAQNPNTPPDVLEKLARDNVRSVRAAVSRNPNTPPDVLDKLADEYTLNVAQNKNTSGNTLARIADPPDSWARYCVAQNLNAPNDILAKLANDIDGDIDFDRQWEQKPYLGVTRTTSGIARTLRVKVEFAFNCGVDAAQISRYAAFAWAVADSIEASGISCEIVLVSSGNNRCDGDFKNLDLEVTVKKAGEYIEPLEIARRFRPDFYRRAIFSIYQLTGDLAGGCTNLALGYSLDSYRRAIPPGAVRIKLLDATNFNADATIKNIKCALGI